MHDAQKVALRGCEPTISTSSLLIRSYVATNVTADLEGIDGKIREFWTNLWTAPMRDSGSLLAGCTGRRARRDAGVKRALRHQGSRVFGVFDSAFGDVFVRG